MVRLPTAFVDYVARFPRLYPFFSVNRGCPDTCTYEDPKEVKKRK